MQTMDRPTTPDAVIPCPVCGATLGELRGPEQVVVVDLAVGNTSNYRRTIVGAHEIRCGKPKRGGGICAGIWRASPR